MIHSIIQTFNPCSKFNLPDAGQYCTAGQINRIEIKVVGLRSRKVYFFSMMSSIANWVSANTLCGSRGSIRTQVPAEAFFSSSPRVNFASPWIKYSSAVIEAVCSESSWPGANPNKIALCCSSSYIVRLSMLSGGISGSSDDKFSKYR